jgi:hypothetical protein
LHAQHGFGRSVFLRFERGDFFSGGLGNLNHRRPI